MSSKVVWLSVGTFIFLLSMRLVLHGCPTCIGKSVMGSPPFFDDALYEQSYSYEQEVQRRL